MLPAVTDLHLASVDLKSLQQPPAESTFERQMALDQLTNFQSRGPQLPAAANVASVDGGPRCLFQAGMQHVKRHTRVALSSFLVVRSLCICAGSQVENDTCLAHAAPSTLYKIGLHTDSDGSPACAAK